MKFTTHAPEQTPAHALSPSQVSTFLDCAARWYFGRIAQLADPPNGALALGSAIHATAAAAMRDKADRGSLCSEAAALKHFEHAIHTHLAAAQLAPDETAETLTETGRKMVSLWHSRIAPEIAPAAVEIAITGEIGGVSIHAIADVITADGIVIDYKTTSKKPGEIRADHAFQLATYGMLSGNDKGRIVTITKTAEPTIAQHTIQIGEAQRKHAEAIYPLVSAAMQSGIYPPRRSSLFCSRKHCAFWRQCVKEFGGEVH